MIEKKRLSPLTRFGLVGFCFVVVMGSIDAFKDLISSKIETKEESIFIIIFTSIFLCFGVMAFRRLLLDYDFKYHISVDKNQKKLSIKSKFTNKSIDISNITKLKVDKSLELNSNFNTKLLRDLEFSVQTTHKFFLGMDLGVTLFLYSKNKLIVKINNINVKSMSNLQKILKDIDEVF